MTSSTKKSVGKTILKVTGIISTILIGIILIVTVLLLTVLEPYAEHFLKKKVSETTEGLYSLDFEDLDINLLATTVRLHNPQLQFDSAVHEKLKEKGEAGPYLLNANIDELEISGINVLDYLFRSRIHILSISIDQPTLNLIHDTEIPQTEDSSSSSNKKKKSIKIINSIKIGDFDLKDAQISYSDYKNKEEIIHEIPQLNINISDLIADSFDKKDVLEMIDMDNFFISLQNQTFTTSNKAYDLKFDLFSYSIADQQLKIKAFSAIGDHTKMKKPMIAPEIKVPLLKIEGLELLKALKTKKLQLQELLIDDTYVELYEIPDLDVTVADVYNGLAQLFEVTEIDDLKIERSSVSMYSRENKDVLIQKIDTVDLLLEDISFDSLSVFDPRNNLALQQLTLNLKNYVLTPEKSPYTFQLAQLNMNTKQDSLRLDGLELIPSNQKNKKLGYKSGSASPQLIALKIPEIHFDGFNLIHAFEKSNLDITKISIPNSTTTIAKIFEEESSGEGFSPKDIYNSFSFFVKEINIHEFLLSNADINQYPTEYKISKAHEIKQAKLGLSAFHFDSTMAYRNKMKAPLEEILFHFNRYRFTSPANSEILSVGPFSYSTRKKSLDLENIKFESHPKKPGEKADSIIASLEHFSISNFDIVAAFNKGSLQIEEILLENPNIYVSRGIKQNQADSEENSKNQKNRGEAVFKWINPVVIESVRVTDGTANYIERLEDITNYQNLEGFLVEINEINLSPKTLQNTENIIPVDNIVLKAKNYTFHSPDSIYTLTLDSLFYSSDDENLKANLFQLSPDLDLNQEKVKEDIGSAHSNLFTIKAEQFVVNKFDLISAYNSGNYAFGEVLFTAPSVSILQNKQVLNYQDKIDSLNENTKKTNEEEAEESNEGENKDQVVEKNLEKQVDKYVNRFKINDLRVEEGKFLFEILKEDSIRESQKLERLSLHITNLQLEDLQANDLTELYKVDEVDLQLKEYNFITPDSLYELRVELLNASLRDQYIRIDSVNFEPLFLIDEYADKLDYAKDRFDVKVGSIDLEGINFKEFFNNQNYIVEKLLINGMSGNIYRDSRVQQDPSRKPRTVQQFVKDLPIPIQLDTFAVKDGVIIYSEVSKDGSIPGVITLSDTDFEITNITNDSLLYSKRDTLKVKGSTTFLEASRMNIAFNFLMNHPEDLYTYEGFLEEMKFEAFNPLFTELLFVKMESGVIEKIDFSVTATRDYSTGMMSFPYENLKFRLLNKDDVGNPGFWLNITNWSLNNLLVKSNNPGRLFNSYREGEISVERNYSKSVFNHMGNSLLSGLISSTIPEPIESIFGFVGLP